MQSAPYSYPSFNRSRYDGRIGLAHWPFGIDRRYEHNFGMVLRAKFVTSLLVHAMLSTAAFNKKKPVLPPPSTAPTVAVELPDELPENPETPAPEVVRATVEPPPVKAKPKQAN